MSDAYNKAVQLNRSELFIGFEWLWACYSHLFHGKFLKIPNAMMCTSTPQHHLLQWNYTRTDTWEPNFHTTHVQTRESLMLLHEGLTQLLSHQSQILERFPYNLACGVPGVIGVPAPETSTVTVGRRTRDVLRVLSAALIDATWPTPSVESCWSVDCRREHN